MSFLLEELGYRLQREDRFKLYLTNTLEMEELAQTELPGMVSLSEESHLAGGVKKETPILAIFGNPPYSGISANMNPWIDKLLKGDVNGLQGYYSVDGKPLGEKKLWLQDDYVKFIRFAQWKIRQINKGVLGFITNHSYLDNPTFRGMRQSLMKSFNEIYILDLHGNTLKKEKCPDGSKDENVFDIQQGVAIALFIIGQSRNKECNVYHSEIWGLRGHKNKWLESNNIKTTKFQKVSPNSPYYFFVPRKEKDREIYETYWKTTDIFPVHITGIVTARDHFVIDFDKNSLKSRIMTFRNKNLPDEVVKDGLELKENYMWRVTKARKELIAVHNWESYFTNILFRPFDIRHIYFHDSVVWRTRKEVMRHMLQENLGIITPKQFKEIPGAFVTQNITAHKTVSAYDINYLFPLYLYIEKNKPTKRSLAGMMMFFEPQAGYGVKKPNLSPALVEKLTKEFKKITSPEQIFFYIYAVLYSNIYRTKYAEFLKIDFPRIPFTRDYKLFSKIAGYGKRLVDLHLLKSSELDPPVAKFQGNGNYRVEKLRYEQEKLFINNDQYFENITPEVWEYQIGGYKVCNQWLKDRKGRTLSLDEIKIYCKIVTSLQKTIGIQKAIDEIYPEIEKEIIEFGKA